MKNMGLGILKRFFSNILHVGKNVIAAGGICPAILETGEKIVAGRGTPIGTYPLGNGLYFDSSSRRLFRKEKAEFVTRQSSTLLLAFLEAENGNLSISEICNVLWPDAGGTSGRVYTAVRRLRVFLEEMCAGAVILNGDCHYQLKIPVSSEENEGMQNLIRSDII